MKIVIYYYHGNTLGHSTRVLALLRGIKCYIPKAEIVVLQDGESSFPLPLSQYAKVYTIPYSVNKKRTCVGASERGGALSNMFKERQTFMRSVVNKHHPDLFITEHFPFGRDPRSDELPYLLDHVKEKIGCRIVGSIGYLNYAEHMHEIIQKYYDAIFIHSPKALALTYLKYLDRRSADELRKVLKDFRKKIHFLNFDLDRPASCSSGKLQKERLAQGFKRLVFVSRGGGVVNDRVIVSSFLAARKKQEWFFVVCCGPATTRKDMKSYQQLAQGARNVLLVHSFTPEEMDQYMDAADLCVCLCGYNTALKLLYFRKRAVLLPHTTSEQRWRAELLTQYIPAVILKERCFTPSSLCSAMEGAINKPFPRKAISPAWFNGAKQNVLALCS
jgi:predicted glycosyltransferase